MTTSARPSAGRSTSSASWTSRAAYSISSARGRERHVARVAAEVADPLRHLGGKGPLLAQVLDLEAALAQDLGDAIRDRRLAAAIDPFEDDKHRSHLTQQ